MTVPDHEAQANYGPAAAVILRGQALSGITGGNVSVDGNVSLECRAGAQPPDCSGNFVT